MGDIGEKPPPGAGLAPGEKEPAKGDCMPSGPGENMPPTKGEAPGPGEKAAAYCGNRGTSGGQFYVHVFTYVLRLCSFSRFTLHCSGKR